MASAKVANTIIFISSPLPDRPRGSLLKLAADSDCDEANIRVFEGFYVQATRRQPGFVAR
jgi:hypothetical protein